MKVSYSSDNPKAWLRNCGKWQTMNVRKNKDPVYRQYIKRSLDQSFSNKQKKCILKLTKIAHLYCSLWAKQKWHEIPTIVARHFVARIKTSDLYLTAITFEIRAVRHFPHLPHLYVSSLGSFKDATNTKHVSYIKGNNTEFSVCHPEVFNKYITTQWCISQTQQNFTTFIIVLGQRVSILIESSSGLSKIQILTVS